jgi:hypothetical protein
LAEIPTQNTQDAKAAEEGLERTYDVFDESRLGSLMVPVTIKDFDRARGSRRRVSFKPVGSRQ